MAVERQSAVVLEENDALLRRLHGHGASLGVVRDFLSVARVGVRMLEEAPQELESQHPPHGRVDLGLCDFPLRQRLRQIGEGLPVRHVVVHAGMQRARGRVRQIAGHVMQRHELLDALVIGDHDALESPLVAQHVGQHPAVGMGRNAADLVVGGHHHLGVGLLDRRTELRQIHLQQRPLGELCRTHVRAGFRHAVSRHVLQRCEDAIGAERQRVTLQAAHLRNSHPAGDVGILAERLLDPSPARIAPQIDDRGQEKLHASCARLARDHGIDPRDERGVPGAGERDGLGEAGGVPRHEAVQAFAVKESRDAEASVIHRVVLHRVDEGDRLWNVTEDVLQRVIGFQGDAVAGPGDLADAVGEHTARLRRIEVAVGILDRALALPDAGNLRDLLLQGHAGEEVVDPRGNRCLRVLVDRFTGGAGCKAGERQAEGEGQRAGAPLRSR